MRDWVREADEHLSISDGEDGLPHHLFFFDVRCELESGFEQKLIEDFVRRAFGLYVAGVEPELIRELVCVLRRIVGVPDFEVTGSELEDLETAILREGGGQLTCHYPRH